MRAFAAVQHARHPSQRSASPRTTSSAYAAGPTVLLGRRRTQLCSRPDDLTATPPRPFPSRLHCKLASTPAANYVASVSRLDREHPGSAFRRPRALRILRDRGGPDKQTRPWNCPHQAGFIRLIGGGGRNRTGVDGFAGRCMTTLPPRQERWPAPIACAAGQTKRESAVLSLAKLERERSLELPTSTLARLRSTN